MQRDPRPAKEAAPLYAFRQVVSDVQFLPASELLKRRDEHLRALLPTP